MFKKLFDGLAVFFSFGMLSMITSVQAQCPVSDFSIQAASCQNGLIPTSNLSTTGSYLWDFCAGDLNNTPTAKVAFTLSGAVGRPGLELAKDGNIWYGFVTATFSNSLYRVTYANGLDNTPTNTENLGDLSGKLNSPGQVRMVQDNGLWYGFVHNLSTGELVKIDFGDHIANSFTASILFSGIGSQNSGFALGKDPTNGWICIISELSNQFRIIRLGNTFTSPGSSDMLLSSAAPNSNNLGDVDLFYECNNWYGFADNFGNGVVYRLDFGSDLFSVPAITQIASLSPSNHGRLRLAKEGEAYFLFVTSLDGKHIKLEFGNDILATPTVIDEGSVGNVLPVNAPFYGIAVAKENSFWTIQISDASNGKIYEIDYPDNCSASPKTSFQSNPDFSYSQFGTYTISLQTTNALGSSVAAKSVIVSAATAPDIDFTSQNNCAGNAVNFTSVNTSGGIVSYNWDFGDGNSSSGINSSNIYTGAGTYIVNNAVVGTNGCQNFIRRSIPIYSQPTVDFTIPSPAVTCTNQAYNFVNTSIYDVGSNPLWQWVVDGTNVSSAKDLTELFSSATTFSVALIATIPGCSPQQIKPFTIQQSGPKIDFTIGSTCQSSPVTFTNNSTGSISGFSWDFGDGNSSTAGDTENTYNTIGPYSVTLTGFTSSGCNNIATKSLTIYSTPQVDFSVALPPFSCNGSISQFNDLTPKPTDSNLASWQWDFADPLSGQNTSASSNPTHTYATAGLYDVKLTVTTDKNCSTTLQKPITILQTPVASFSNTPTCKNTGATFTDTSIDSKTRTWQIESSIASTPSITHVFSSSGNYSVNLAITANNGCFSATSKIISVPAPLTPDFSSQKTCTNQDTNFTDVTISSTDPITRYDWDFGVGAAVGTPATFSFATAGNYGVKLKVTAQSGCSYGVTKNVNIITSPTASFTAFPSSGVPPFLVHFNNTSSLATNYLWAFNDAKMATSTDASPVYTFTDFGNTVVDLTAFNPQGCSNTFSKIISAILPMNDVSITALNTIKNADGSLSVIATLKNNGNTGVSDANMIMDLSGIATIRESINTTLAPKQLYNHLFNYQITNLKQLDYLCAEVQIADDVNLYDNQLCISLQQEIFAYPPYPNPASTDVHFDFVAAESDLISVVFTDAVGKQMFQATFQVVAGLNQFIVPVNNFSRGIYIITIQTSTMKKVSQIAIYK